jgi:glycosyltransferase involved in cell wall biosynthesis
MPVYNEPIPVLQRTIDSLVAQTFRDFELVAVVDNPAREDVRAFLASLAGRDARVRYVVNEVNRGVWASYNRGIRLAQGTYLAIQDADDESVPTRLELLYDFLQNHPDVDVVGGALEYVDDQTGAVLMTRYYPASVDAAIKRYAPLAHGTTLRKGTLHERFGYYDETPEVRHAADYDLWLRWHAQGVVLANVPAIVYRYYQSATNFKARHVRGILKDTITSKRRYADRLRFGLLDYAYLGMEALAALLPERLILALFYHYNAWRAWLNKPLTAELGRG